MFYNSSEAREGFRLSSVDCWTISGNKIYIKNSRRETLSTIPLSELEFLKEALRKDYDFRYRQSSVEI